MMPNFRQRLSYSEYFDRSAAHTNRLDGLLGDFFDQRSLNQPHAILDFIVEYYSFRKSALYNWSPGIGVGVEIEDESQLSGSIWDVNDHVATVSTTKLTSKRKRGLNWNLNILTSIDTREPTFNCMGMHEWAMVYKSSDVRHPHIPLRLSHEDIDSFVVSHPLSCSHIDAYRFFTKEALPLNRYQPTRETQFAHDQPGCLHVSMDLYKWAYKAYPWVDSDLIADTFELAIDTRILDMQASPYDVSKYGYPPVAIETREGQHEYVQRQRELSERASPLRKRLIQAYTSIIETESAISEEPSYESTSESRS